MNEARNQVRISSLEELAIDYVQSAPEWADKYKVMATAVAEVERYKKAADRLEKAYHKAEKRLSVHTD